jgi:outer membrane receptor protein involved in Fe transport
VRGLNVISLNASEFLDNTSGDTVATYLGEIPLYVDYKMKDVQRVEVLLGPQGTLYGAGTLGGAIRYIPRAPDTSAFSVEAHGDTYSLAHSSGAGYQADGAFNVPIIDGKLAFRAALSYVDDPGFIDYPYVLRTPGVSNPQPDFGNPADVAANLRRVDDADWEQTSSGRLALRWDASDAVQATFNYYFQNADVGGRSVDHRAAFGTGEYEAASRFLEPNERDNSLLSAEIVADLGFAKLTSATGVSSYDQLGQRDQTDLLLDFEVGYETFPSFAAYTRDSSQEDRVNQEIRLVSSGTGHWAWIGGLFYNHFKLNAISAEHVPGFPEFAGITVPTGDLEYQQLTHRELTEKALFGEVSYRFGDALTLTVGGREFDYATDQLISYTLPLVDFGSEQGNSAGDDGFLGKLNLAYQFDRDVMGYVTLSEGYRIGGVNSVAPCVLPLDTSSQNVCALPNEILIKPDRTTNLEVGVHSTLRDGALLLNADVYSIDWRDVQTMGTTVNGDIPIAVNGGKARSRGLELGVQTRGLEHWTLAGSYAYNNAELTTDAIGLVDGADAFAGDRLPGTPQHQAGFYTSYDRMLRNGYALDVGYGFTYSSDVITKIGLRSDGETLGGYTVHSASIGVSKHEWTASLYADNLTDVFAETSVRQDPSFIRTVASFDSRRYFRNVLRPRSVGLEVRYRFGK